MIKKSLLVGMAASLMLFSACSSSDEVSENTVSNENQIQLLLNSTGAGLSSRAARELNTSAPADNVDRVALKLYRYVGGEWVLEEGCFESDEIEWVGDNGPVTTQIVKVKNLDENTQYKVIAYGYNGSCPYTVTEQGGSLLATDAPYDVEELFAGSSDTFQTDGDGRVTELVNIEMTRQVAGVLGYFTNIPVMKIIPGTTDLSAVRYINVYVAATSKGFTFPSKGQYNGYEQEVAKTKIISFDLKKYVENYDEQVAAAKSDVSAMFEIPVKEGPVTLKPNSIIKGVFLIPFASHVEENTLMVEMEDADNTVLKHWNVSYAQSTGNPFQFDIQRNSFYGLGRKIHDNALGLDPNDPFDPDGPEGDKPLDMSAVEFTVTLIAQWDKVYYMTID